MAKEHFLELGLEELELKLDEAKGQLREYRFSNLAGTLASSSNLRLTRKNIARLFTRINEFKLGIRKVENAK